MPTTPSGRSSRHQQLSDMLARKQVSPSGIMGPGQGNSKSEPRRAPPMISPTSGRTHLASTGDRMPLAQEGGLKIDQSGNRKK